VSPRALEKLVRPRLQSVAYGRPSTSPLTTYDMRNVTVAAAASREYYPAPPFLGSA
jgi:hypothetical protein